MKKHLTIFVVSFATLLALGANAPGGTTDVYFSQKLGGMVMVPDFLQDGSEFGNQGGASIVQTRQNFLNAVAAAGLAAGTESFEGDPFTSGINGFPPFFPHDLPTAPGALAAPLDFEGLGTGVLNAASGYVLNLGDYEALGISVDPGSRFPYDDGAANTGAGARQYVGSLPEGTVSIALAQPVYAFGFFAMDVADVAALMSVQLNYVGGGFSLFDLADYGYMALDPDDNLNATSIYFGVVSDMAIGSVNIINAGPFGMDQFGLDVLTIGVKSSVPETGHTLLLSSSMFGLIAFAAVARRRRNPDELV